MNSTQTRRAALSSTSPLATIGAVEEGSPNDEPPEGKMMAAPDRLWRHPAERGAEQAAANLAARRVYGRRWPSMVMSFIAGCTLIGAAWMLQEEAGSDASDPGFGYEIPPTTRPPQSNIAFNEWSQEVAQLNQTSVVALELVGSPQHETAQAILLSTEGHLLASAHSLLGADPEQIFALLYDGERLPAKLVASDAVSGVAVLKINSPELPPPTYGDELQVLAGDQLVGLARTDEPRIVDLLGKDYVTSLPNDDLLSGLFRLSDDLSDTWAGAAILDEDGAIVGMVVESRDGGHFGIPTSFARDVARDLIETGTVDHRAWLGVDGLVELSDGIKEERSLFGGVLILRVWDETPAAKAGLVAGDIIVGAGSVNVLDRTDLGLVMATLNPGDSIEIRYSRATPALPTPDATDPKPGDLAGELFSTIVTVGAAPIH